MEYDDTIIYKKYFLTFYTNSLFPLYLFCIVNDKVFWCLAANSLHLQASLENFNCRQLAKTLCWVELESNIL